MVTANKIRLTKWCVDCRLFCEWQCSMVMMSPTIKVHMEHLIQSVQYVGQAIRLQEVLTTAIAKTVTSKFKPLELGVMIEVRHGKDLVKNNSTLPPAVCTFSMTGKMRKRAGLRRECFNMSNQCHPVSRY